MMTSSLSRRFFSLFLIGLLFIAAGVVLLWHDGTTPVLAQDDEAEYIGLRECGFCHGDLSDIHRESRHAQTFQDVEEDKGLILGDFSQGEDIRQIQFPGESAPRAVTPDDILYTIGSGRYVQRYLIGAAEDEYMVLPVEWNTITGAWQEFTLGDGEWPSEAYDWNSSCAACHVTGYNAQRSRWEDEGVQCEACHGPGSAHADEADDAGSTPNDSEFAAIRAAINPGIDPQVCGQCHSQGTEPDENRPFPLEYVPGADLLSDRVFNLVEPGDEVHWWRAGHALSPNMQFNEWLTSDHAESLTNMRASDYADDSCLTCHSGDYRVTGRLRATFETSEREGEPPAALTLATAQFGVSCATCHDPHSEGEIDFSLVDETYALCTTCHTDANRAEGAHNPVQELYEGLPLVENVVPVVSTHFTEGVDCVTCHMPPTRRVGETAVSGSHTWMTAVSDQLAENQPDSCTSCHTDLSRDSLVEFTLETQAKVETRLTNIHEALQTQESPPDWVVRAYEAVEKDGSLGIHNYNYTSSLLDAVEVELQIVEGGALANISVRPVENPADCAECHENEFRLWESSPHANASLGQAFLEEYASRGQPSFCMNCHASGFDPQTEEYVFDGVVCSNCHFAVDMAEHPPGPVEVASDSQICGTCHSGEHSPEYNQWLVSDHSVAGVDCADCHTPHNNGLRLETVNDTCGDCHQDALVDEIHMAEDMTCVDCHMSKRITNDDGLHELETVHTMGIDPATCAECHGNTHLLAFDENQLPEEERELVMGLRAEVEQMETQAENNLQSGIVGGAIGALVLVVIVLAVIRFGRVR